MSGVTPARSVPAMMSTTAAIAKASPPVWDSRSLRDSSDSFMSVLRILASMSPRTLSIEALCSAFDSLRSLPSCSTFATKASTRSALPSAGSMLNHFDIFAAPREAVIATPVNGAMTCDCRGRRFSHSRAESVKDGRPKSSRVLISAGIPKQRPTSCKTRPDRRMRCSSIGGHRAIVSAAPTTKAVPQTIQTDAIHRA